MNWKWVIDFVKKNGLNSKNCSIAFLIFSFVFILIKLYSFCLDNNGWIIGDWLINYVDGGFKRRGLSGSLFFLMQNFTGFQLNVLINAVLVVLYLLFLYFVISILWVKKINIFFFSLLLSPLTFLFYYNDSLIIGRKEIIIFLIYVYFLHALLKKKLTTRKEWIICFFITIATLFHEMMFLYIPYFIITLYLDTSKIELKRYAKYFIASFVPVLLILLMGKHVNEGNTFQILLNRGIDLRYKVGMLTWPDDFNVINYIKANWSSYSLYLISFLICLGHFSFYLLVVDNKKMLELLSFFVISILYSIPLFLMAIDWGRWFHIHFTLFMLLLLSLLPNKNDVFSIHKKVANKYYLILFFIITINLLLMVQHCDNGLAIHHYQFKTVKKIFSLFGL